MFPNQIKGTIFFFIIHDPTLSLVATSSYSCPAQYIAHQYSSTCCFSLSKGNKDERISLEKNINIVRQHNSCLEIRKQSRGCISFISFLKEGNPSKMKTRSKTKSVKEKENCSFSL